MSLSPGSKDGVRDDRSPLAIFVRGFVVALPVVLVFLAVEKLVGTVRDAMTPVLDLLPGVLINSPAIRFVLACATLACAVFLLGVLSRTNIGRALGHGMERGVLLRVPFYSLLKNVASGLAGSDDERSLKAVLVTMSTGIEQIGFQVEQCDDGRYVVFLPSAPNTSSGTVLIVNPDLVRVLAGPGHKILRGLSSFGMGVKGGLR